MLGDNEDLNLDQLGQQLSAQAAKKGEERRAEAAAAAAGGSSTDQILDSLKAFTADKLIEGASNFFTTRANKKAFDFQQREAIQAATAQYNNGMDNSIKLKTMFKTSENHKTGQVEYWVNYFTPEAEKEIFKTINEENYRKAGIDKYVDTLVRGYVENTFMPLLIKGNEAANRMNNTKEDFQRFIIVNDGIADNPAGKALQAFTGLFKGKDSGALEAEARIVNSKLVKSAEAVNMYNRLISRGFNVKDAVKVGQNLEKYRYTDADYNIEKSREFKTEKHTINGIDVVVGFTEVVYANERGATRKKRIYEGDSQKFADQLNGERVDSEPTTIGGEQAIKQTVYSLVNGQPIDPIIRHIYRGPDEAGIENISDQASATANNMLQEYMNLTTAEIGGTDTFTDFDYGDIINKFYNGGDSFAGNTPATVVNSIIENKDKHTVNHAAIINKNFKIRDYDQSDKQLPLHLATAARMLDVRRMFDNTNPFVADLDFGSGRRIASAEPSYLETFEAIGLVNSVRPSITIDYQMIVDAANSPQFAEELAFLRRDSKEDSFTKGKVKQLVATFEAYKKNEEDIKDIKKKKYQYLFDPIIKKVSVINPRTNIMKQEDLETPISIYAVLEDIERTMDQ